MLVTDDVPCVTAASPYFLGRRARRPNAAGPRPRPRLLGELRARRHFAVINGPSCQADPPRTACRNAAPPGIPVLHGIASHHRLPTPCRITLARPRRR